MAWKLIILAITKKKAITVIKKFHSKLKSLLVLLILCCFLGFGTKPAPTFFRKSGYKLNLSNKHLTEIPDYVFKLTELKYLNLHHNQLTTIPPEIKNLVNLEKLILSRNDLVEIPPEIGELK
ncbi:MAG: leucine-rich repeat domain-containing protein, partial [Crocinitomix sp.]|nr:leucine-rich repeat domain-containing protein [Crocinitomix sp.]